MLRCRDEAFGRMLGRFNIMIYENLVFSNLPKGPKVGGYGS